MNVEQLIEDGWKEYLKWATCETASNADMGSFEFGVRHALAALFPVVWEEDFQQGKSYMAKSWLYGRWEPVTVWREQGGRLAARGIEKLEMDHYIEFRGPIPSPGDLGIGGV